MDGEVIDSITGSSLEGPIQSLPKIEPHLYKPVFGPKNTLNKKGTREIPVFHPSLNDMQNFSSYVQNIERRRAHLDSGIAKIVPPAAWLAKARPYFKYDGLGDMTIKKCLAGKVQKVDTNQDGVYFQQNNHKIFNRNGTTVGEFMSKSTGPINSSIGTSGPGNLPKKCKTLDSVIDYFWANIDNQYNRSSVYGADLEGTLFDDRIESFNPNKLNTLMDLAKETGMNIPGITSSYLYFGSYRTAFSWHTEDMDLYSLNYQHFGEPKIWYSIPNAVSDRFEKLCAQLYQPFGITCHTFIRHKICITSPEILEKHQIPYGCIAQFPGEFIITFPRGYHMGFNVGFNCNEAINFATNRWFGYGLQSNICNCNPEIAVRMNLKDILQKFAENDQYKEYFIREPTKSTERKSLAVAVQKYIKASTPVVKRLLIFDSSFEQEIQYNEEQAQKSPFCCICQYITPETNCQLKGPIRKSSKSPCYVSTQMLTKMQNSSNLPYRPDRSSGAPYLPFPDSPLRQCAKCKIAVHANCYSFIEGLPKIKCLSSKKPPEIQRVLPSASTNSSTSFVSDVKPKTIRITVPKHCLADKNIEREASLSPVSSLTLQFKNGPAVKSKKLTSKTESGNNIYKKIMNRVIKSENKGESSSNHNQKKSTVVKSSSLKLIERPGEKRLEEENSITVIKPIVSKYEIFGGSDKTDDVKCKQQQKSYTKQPDKAGDSEWLCDPCRLLENEDLRKYVCCDFCNMRGGALIQRKMPDLSETSYVHVICAILSRSTSIERNKKDELIAHCLPSPREYSVLKKNVNKNVLQTSGSKIRLCSTYSHYDKSLFCGNFDDSFCGLCKEPLHEVLVKCEKCHLEARKMESYHPTCAHLLGFQFCARLYPELLVATCPAHVDLSNDPREDVKVGDIVVHQQNEEFNSLAEVTFIGTITSDILLSFQGGYSEISSQLLLTCECRSSGCNGNHKPGYLIATRNRGALGFTLGFFRGRRTERTFRVKHDDGLSIRCQRKDIFIQTDSNCPLEYKRMLMKRKAESELLELMTVPVKRERRTVLSNFGPYNLLSIKSEPIDDIDGTNALNNSNDLNGTSREFTIKQEVEDELIEEQSMS